MLMAVDVTKHLEQMLGQAAVVSPPPAPGCDWCMILVRPGAEQEARDSLRRRGVGAWWPNYNREIKGRTGPRQALGHRTLWLPVLPGVILSPARFTETFWRALDESVGVINVARKYNSDVVLLCDVDIVLVHKIEAGLNRGVKPVSDHPYRVGDKVRLVDDDLRRWPVGKVIRARKGEGLEIEINILGALRTMRVAVDQIEPVEAHPARRG